ncbi:apolipoprotein n-acyltransferase [Moniliophthora roreri MCA 2997]|uniref:Apolipoprotein n-acyltransferase n=1 Tax=Moniliophthora roreri (strain MCA 2997) TaxID=1381753 RepID=V2XYZ9_MONRO|nr:apolipoprotein n-acyltransferase [Moniliophthora roreri MCA 2997]
MSLRYEVFHARPHLYLWAASVLSSAFASTTIPSFLLLAVHLSILCVYGPILLDRRGQKSAKIARLWVGISISRSISWFAPSIHALDTPAVSVLVLLGQAMATSAITLTVVLLYIHLRTRVPMPAGTQYTLFPALWAGIWCAMAYCSPVGYLTSWTPVVGTESYDWLVPLLGPAVKNWLVAAWAVVGSQALEHWMMEWESPEEAPLIPAHDMGSSGLSKKDTHNHYRGSNAFIFILVALAAPPFLLGGDLPLPVISPDTTPLSVGCVLPSYRRYKHTNLNLDDYIEETKKLASQADILLWPEGAVSFQGEDERDAAFDKIRSKVPGAHVGVSFEETYPDPHNPTGKSGLKRNGMAIISKADSKPHLIYYKRHLVPIAESYSMRAGEEDPSIYDLELHAPKDMNKTDWSKEPPHIRHIPLTASICLDFAMPSPFSALESRPALILAPGRTWETTVGRVMWEQAKQRAYELGSTVLWCDGGDGGISGVAGEGVSESIQVGKGSWVRQIGIQYEFDEGRTLYGRAGNWLIWGLIGLPLVLGPFEAVIGLLPNSGLLSGFGNMRRQFIAWKDRRRIEDNAEHEDLMS